MDATELREAIAPDLEILDEAKRLTAEMVSLAHDRLLMDFRFMNRPFAQLPTRASTDVNNCATDARELVFAPGFALQAHANNKPLLARAYLHMTLHCLLRHPFPPEGVDPLRWTVACDLAVTALLEDMDRTSIHLGDERMSSRLAELSAQVEEPTAGAFYRLLDALDPSEEELFDLAVLFGIDSHEPWFPDADSSPDAYETAESARVLQERWEKVARQTQMDMDAQLDSEDSERMSTTLSELQAEPMGLEELLRQFAAPHENIEMNLDEFDYIYYTYGLRTYGNVPLVEPLEYCDTPDISDFVIAIDTSGSVSGPLVETFVARACGMLLASDAIGPRSRVRIVQCDCEVQDEAVVRDADDVSAYLAGLELKGHGSTDFRPVFDHVDGLLASGEIEDLDGLLYFTDGLGEFPDEAPPYDVAVVFVDQTRPVPSWATTVLAYSDELF